MSPFKYKLASIYVLSGVVLVSQRSKFLLVSYIFLEFYYFNYTNEGDQYVQ